MSPHYISASSGLSGSSLTANFKIAGLGDNQTITVTLTANATARYACINGGGNHPQATNKETVSGPVSASGDFTSGKNGNVVGSLTAPAPGAGDFSCPNGQRLVLTFVKSRTSNSRRWPGQSISPIRRSALRSNPRPRRDAVT